MAKTTVEDCLDENGHFYLAYSVGKRGHSLVREKNPKVPEDNDKPIVVALREVAHDRAKQEGQ